VGQCPTRWPPCRI